MKGHIRQRKNRQGSRDGGSWEYVVEIGEFPRQRCTSCGKVQWLTDTKPAHRCRCGGELSEPVMTRKRKFVGGFKTQAAAAKAMRAALVKLDVGTDPFPDKLIVTDYVNTTWLPHLETQGRLTPSTIRTYRQQMRDFVLPAIGSLEMRKVQPRDVQQILDGLTKKGKSPRTVAHVRTTMSAAFQHAWRLQLVPVNVARAAEAPAKRKPELRTPNAAELRTIIEQAKGTMWEMPILLSATTGARRGEVLGLRWCNVDLERGRIRIVEGLHWTDRQFVFLPPKTATSVRTISLLADVVERLKAYRVEQAQRLLALGVRVTDQHVVCDRGDGTPIEPSTYSHAAARIAKAAGLDGVRLHDFRHGVATTLASSGNRPELTSRMLGHASVGFTLSVYTHPSDDEMDKVAELLQRAITTGAE